jgi:hypothetical protein
VNGEDSMKKLLMIAAMIAAFGLGTAAAFAASSDKPPSPPGQDECEHGNTQKPCKEDPQPDRGADCEEHGNHGGVNEDRCKETETTPTETTPTETTPTETTPTETTSTQTTANQTTPAETTPAETTPRETTPTETTPTETTAADPEEEQQEQVSSPAQETTAAQSQPVAVAGGEAATGPSKAAQPAHL